MQMADIEEYNRDKLKVSQTSTSQALNRSESIKLVVDESTLTDGGAFDALQNVMDRKNAVHV